MEATRDREENYRSYSLVPCRSKRKLTGFGLLINPFIKWCSSLFSCTLANNIRRLESVFETPYDYELMRSTHPPNLKKEWKLNPPVGEPMTAIFRGLSFEDERPQYPITHEDRKKISYSPGLFSWGCQAGGGFFITQSLPLGSNKACVSEI